MRLVPLLFAVLTTSALAQDPFAPPGTALDGQSPESLAASWWQWAASAPEELSPVRDRTGTHCAVGQTGEAWFLAGGYGSSKIRRACTVPKGRHLLFPVINMVYWPATDGYWVILKPLPAGKHVLKFGGRYNRESGAFGRIVQDIEYELEVK